MNSGVTMWVLLGASFLLGFSLCFISKWEKGTNPRFSKGLRWSSCVTLVLVAIVLLVQYELLTFDASLTAGNVLQASATIFVGILVASFIQRSAQADRKEKDILLNNLDSVIKILDELGSFGERGALTKITATLKKLSVECKKINTFLQGLEYPREIVKQLEYSEQIKVIRKLATETPIKEIKKHAKEAKCSSSVRDGIIELAQERAALLDTKIQEMKGAVFKAQIMINRV